MRYLISSIFLILIIYSPIVYLNANSLEEYEQEYESIILEIESYENKIDGYYDTIYALDQEIKYIEQKIVELEKEIIYLEEQIVHTEEMASASLRYLQQSKHSNVLLSIIGQNDGLDIIRAYNSYLKLIDACLNAINDLIYYETTLNQSTAQLEESILLKEELLTYNQMLIVEADNEIIRLKEEAAAVKKEAEYFYLNELEEPEGQHQEWMDQAGIAREDQPYADFIITHESNWNYTATNPVSGAYGLCQALPGEKMASAGDDWQTNPVTQLIWCDDYAQSRYGSWEKAYLFWVENYWW